ncbi:hypothetical protein BHM03_00055943 [Ensete ventricosum]|nr:hypothetical protein BHM03_00055943 [Ensete ventricosum]
MRAMTFFLEEVRSQSSTEMGCAASRAADLVLASRGDGHGKWTSIVDRSVEEGWMVMANSQLGGSIESHPWEVALIGALGKENRGGVLCGVAGA